MTDGKGSTSVTIRLPVSVMSRLREAAGQDCRSMGSLVRKFVVKGLEAEAEKSA